MQNYQYILNAVAGKETLTIFIGGVPTTVDDTHPAFSDIVDGLGTLTAKEIRELMDNDKRVARTLAQFGNVTVQDGEVLYKGEVVNGLLADRMTDMLERGMDIRPWALFLENLQQNPAKHAVDELFLWLDRSGMPITERGNFLAYKKVKDDYTSYHRNPDGTDFRNDIGTMVTMPRNKVCDDRNRTCSSGLHFCSWDYLPSYMGNRGKVVLVEVNPAHVVSIPSDYNNAKGRAEGYLIVGEIPEDQAQHAFPGTSFVSFDDSDYITYEGDDADFSLIEDGWYNEDWDQEETDSDCNEAYEAGYSEGMTDGYNNHFFDDDAGCDFFGVLAEEYSEGYADGFYAGSESRVADQAEEALFEADQLVLSFIIEDEEDESAPTTQSWTTMQVAKEIAEGWLTFDDFVEEFDPSYVIANEVKLRLAEDFGVEV